MKFVNKYKVLKCLNILNSVEYFKNYNILRRLIVLTCLINHDILKFSLVYNIVEGLFVMLVKLQYGVN